MTPEDISAARGVNVLLGVCLIVMGLFFLLPVFATLYYDGIGKVPDWSLLFWGFLAFGGGMTCLGVWLLRGPQRVGAEVSFKKDGFDIGVRSFFRGDQQHSVAWSDIESVKMIIAPRGGDVLAFRLFPNAAVTKGLIQPTTRFNASTKLVKREISLPINLSNVTIHEAFKRFEASSNQAGAKFVKSTSFNALVIQHKVWDVEH